VQIEALTSRKRPLLLLSSVALVWSLLSLDPFSLIFLSLLSVSWLYYLLTGMALKKMDILRSISRTRLFTGESISIRYTLTGRYPIVIHAEALPTVRMKTGFVSNKSQRVIVKHNSSAVIEWIINFRSRGEKDISSLLISVKDPLGLFSYAVRYSLSEKVLVLPTVMEFETLPLRLRELSPGKRSDFKLMEDLTDFRGIREYHGEPLNRIHWKTSAKMGALYSREFGYTAVSRTRLYLHLNLTGEVFARDVWEKIRLSYEELSVRIAASFIRNVYLSHGRISLVTVGEDVKRIDGTGRDWIDFFEILSTVGGRDEGEELYKVLEQDLSSFDPATTVVILSLYLGEEILPYLVRARSRACQVVVILLPFGIREPGRLPGRSYQMLPRAIENLKRRALLLEEERIVVRIVEDNQSLHEVLDEIQAR